MFTAKGWGVVVSVTALVIVFQAGLAAWIYHQVFTAWFIKICLANFLGMTALLRVLCQMLPQERKKLFLK